MTKAAQDVGTMWIATDPADLAAPGRADGVTAEDDLAVVAKVAVEAEEVVRGVVREAASAVDGTGVRGRRRRSLMPRWIITSTHSKRIAQLPRMAVLLTMAETSRTSI
jgi:hypothetical protein